MRDRGAAKIGVPFHELADMLANGDSIGAIIEAFPQLSEAQVQLAALYAEAYPRRGRPRSKPFSRARSPIALRETTLDKLLPTR